MNSFFSRAAALGAITAACCFSSTSRAEDTRTVVVVDREPRTETTERRVSGGPDMRLVGSGIVVLGISYGASVYVASTSDHHGDSHLFVPVVGPWLDLTDRGSCPVANTACDPETTAKVFLVVDGIFQAVGAISIVSGLLSTSHRERDVEEAKKPKLYVSPAQLGRHGYGLAATGTF